MGESTPGKRSSKNKSSGVSQDRTVGHLLGQIFPNPVTNMQSLIKARKGMAQKHGHGSNEFYGVMDLSADGGECPRCGTEWELDEVKNRFADFHYFEPSCRCFPKCERCGRSLHEEFLLDGFAMKCGCGWKRKNLTEPS